VRKKKQKKRDRRGCLCLCHGQILRGTKEWFLRGVFPPRSLARWARTKGWGLLTGKTFGGRIGSGIVG
jgi:hypothetical protein